MFNEDEAKLIKSLQLLTSKPVLYVANVNEDGFNNNPHLTTLTDYASSENSQVVSVCADIEAEIAELDDEDKQGFLDEMGQSESGLDRLIKAGYRLLGLHTYFTADRKKSEHGQLILETRPLLPRVKYMVTLRKALFALKQFHTPTILSTLEKRELRMPGSFAPKEKIMLLKMEM